MAENNFKFNTLLSNTSAFEEIAALHRAIISNCSQTVVIDITQYEYIYPSMATIIASSIYLGKQYSRRVVIRYNQKNAKCVEFLKNSGILSHYSKNTQNEISLDNVGVPFNRTVKFEDSFEVVREILKSTPVVLTKNLSDNLFSKISEIFDNAFTHGKSEIGVFCCGFMSKNNVFSFSVYDAGIGICKSVNTYLNQDLSCDRTLEWAFKKGNSALNGTADFPRGVGLNLLENFVVANDGQITLVSQGGYCEVNAKNRVFKNLAAPIIGTCFSVSINTDTDHIYGVVGDKR